jgi:hypothetical protein
MKYCLITFALLLSLARGSQAQDTPPACRQACDAYRNSVRVELQNAVEAGVDPKHYISVFRPEDDPLLKFRGALERAYDPGVANKPNVTSPFDDGAAVYINGQQQWISTWEQPNNTDFVLRPKSMRDAGLKKVVTAAIDYWNVVCCGAIIFADLGGTSVCGSDKYCIAYGEALTFQNFPGDKTRDYALFKLGPNGHRILRTETFWLSELKVPTQQSGEECKCADPKPQVEENFFKKLKLNLQ